MALQNEAPIGAGHGGGATALNVVSPGKLLTTQPPATSDASKLISRGSSVTEIPKELYDDLLREANERGITVEQAYLEELEAQEELKRITPPIEELLKMARVGGAPEYMKNE